MVASHPALDLVAAARAAGYAVLATSSSAAVDLDTVELTEPTMWLFGNEAAGLPPAVIRSVDQSVRVPIYGRAESLNLAAAAAVCLYASARAQRAG